MSALVVIVAPMRWTDWLVADDGRRFAVGMTRPDIQLLERVYVVSHGRLRDWGNLTGLERREDDGQWMLCRTGSVPVTIPEVIKPFKGARVRWWDVDLERPFPAWRTEGVVYPDRKPPRKKPLEAVPTEQASLFGDTP